jgi:hypothetical protein
VGRAYAPERVEARAFTSNRLWPERVRIALLLVLLLGIWRCPVAELLGFPCPGCGLTRAALALALGDLAGAVRMHPLAPVLIPFGVGLVWRELAPGAARGGLRRARRPGSDGLAAALGAGVAILTVGVWIARFFGALGGPAPVSSHLHG